MLQFCNLRETQAPLLLACVPLTFGDIKVSPLLPLAPFSLLPVLTSSSILQVVRAPRCCGSAPASFGFCKPLGKFGLESPVSKLTFRLDHRTVI
jgi:hypothetical protein